MSWWRKITNQLRVKICSFNTILRENLKISYEVCSISCFTSILMYISWFLLLIHWILHLWDLPLDKLRFCVAFQYDSCIVHIFNIKGLFWMCGLKIEILSNIWVVCGSTWTLVDIFHNFLNERLIFFQLCHYISTTFSK